MIFFKECIWMKKVNKRCGERWEVERTKKNNKTPQKTKKTKKSQKTTTTKNQANKPSCGVIIGEAREIRFRSPHNLINRSLYHCRDILKISSKSTHTSLRNGWNSNWTQNGDLNHHQFNRLYLVSLPTYPEICIKIRSKRFE